MLDRPVSRFEWEACEAALVIEGRAYIGGRYVAALSGNIFASTLKGIRSHEAWPDTNLRASGQWPHAIPCFR